MRVLRLLSPLLALLAIACADHGKPPQGVPPVAASDHSVPAPGVATARPAWAARGVVADAVDVPAQSYTVVSGDTLRGIAEKTGAGSEAIARANRLAAPFVIHPGERLQIPGGRYHKVKSGESGIAIARAYGVQWGTIVTLNDLEDPYVLRVGQRIALPSAAAVRAMTLEQRAAAFRINIDDLITGAEPAVAANAPAVAPVTSARKPVPSTVAVAEPARFAGRFDWPLTGAILRRFGPLDNGRVSEGINIAVPSGTPIRAAADGVVAYAGDAIAVFGGLILIKHGDGWITAYGHAAQLLVTRGQAVKRGQVIARAGETGQVDQPQLHFEIRDKRRPVDPLRYLPSRS